MLERMKSAVQRMMLGRNGMDSLNYALLWGYVGLYVLRAVIVGVTRWRFAGWLLDTAGFFLALYLLFRLFSRNLSRRQEENRRWLAVWGRIRRTFSGAAARHNDKEHKYFTCKKCGAVCRVPRGKGKIVITCPRCGEQIQAKT